MSNKKDTELEVWFVRYMGRVMWGIAGLMVILQLVNLFFHWDKPDHSLIVAAWDYVLIAIGFWFAATAIDLLTDIRNSLQ